MSLFPVIGTREVNSAVVFLICSVLMMPIVIARKPLHDVGYVPARPPLAPSLIDAHPKGEGGVRVMLGRCRSREILV